MRRHFFEFKATWMEAYGMTLPRGIEMADCHNIMQHLRTLIDSSTIILSPPLFILLFAKQAHNNNISKGNLQYSILNRESIIIIS
jgi:hypothetical protein